MLGYVQVSHMIVMCIVVTTTTTTTMMMMMMMMMNPLQRISDNVSEARCFAVAR